MENLKDNIHAILHGTKEEKARLEGHFFCLADTPAFMKKIGLTGDYFEVRYGVIVRHAKKDAAHNLTEQNWLDILNEITKPFAIAKHGEGYRLFVDTKINGKHIAIGIDVKLIGKELEVNSISTAFGYEGNVNNENILYRSKNITLEQAGLLDGLNSLSLPPEQGFALNITQSNGKSSFHLLKNY